MDISEAFDCISDSRFITKLEAYSFGIDMYSSGLEFTLGVPQGSVL